MRTDIDPFSTPTGTIDQRIAPRHRVLKGAQILIAKLGITKNCVVKNISETGALLSLPDTHEIPSNFLLMIKGETKRIACRIAWRSPDRVGVAFVPDGPASIAN